MHFNIIYMFNSLFYMLILIVVVLISLSYLTLLERKILGFIQLRKGPNKVFYWGLLQPFSDALKLFSKESMVIKSINYWYYMISPVFSMCLMLVMWMLIPVNFELVIMDFNILFFLCLLSMGVFGLMINGWSSNSFYSMLGSIRSISQTISYEVSLIFIILSILILVEGFSFLMLIEYQVYIMFSLYLLPMKLMFLISLIAELNRSPFDLAEGESELVSGFNVEYMSGSFALIFMAEYGMIMLMSVVIVIFFWGSSMLSWMFFMKVMFFNYLVIMFRGGYPRIRYDQLMMMVWKLFLPVILNLFLYVYMYKILYLYYLHMY